MWLLLNNKAPTWDILQKRSYEGHGQCCLCKVDSENNTHLIMSCAFTLEVWQESNQLTGLNNAWRGNSIEEALRNWCMNKETKSYRDLPLTISWGIWLA